MPNGDEYFLIPFYFPGVSESILEEARTARPRRQEPPSDFPFEEIKDVYLNFLKPLVRILEYIPRHRDEGIWIAWEKTLKEAKIPEAAFLIADFFELLLSVIVSIRKSVYWMLKLPIVGEMHGNEKWQQIDVLFDIVRELVDKYDKWKGPVGELILDDIIANWE